MKVIFSSLFQADLTEAEAHYSQISPRLAEAFHLKVKENLRVIIRRLGGDHVGPQGFPCRKCAPFPYMIYYELEAERLLILGLVHKRRHPDYLRSHLDDEQS